MTVARIYIIPAADGTQIPAYLTLPPGKAAKNLPTVIQPHGGPEDRDKLRFDWLAQFLASRGYLVIEPEFRGTLGYGDLLVLAWFVASAATVGGALGSGLESDEAIHAAAYSKREEERRNRIARERK